MIAGFRALRTVSARRRSRPTSLVPEQTTAAVRKRDAVKLRYGVNPQQATAEAAPVTPGSWPVTLLNGQPSYINVLDALNAWQLVHQAGQALGKPVAASFKHVSPAGAAAAGPIDEATAALYGVDPDTVGETASAYIRARDADPKSSYGDFAAVSRPVDDELAAFLSRVFCDGIIAPGFEPGVIARLSKKKKGSFLIMEAEEDFVPPARETREFYGVSLTQDRDNAPLTKDQFTHVTGAAPSAQAIEDLLLGQVVLRFTQSNSTCYLRDGVTLGIGAGQQSRVDCTRLAGAKTDTWWLRRHPSVRALTFQEGTRLADRINWQIRYLDGDLTPDEQARFAEALTSPAPDLTDADRREWAAGLADVAFTSDGALPFRDNVDHAARRNVSVIAEPGGSIRSDDVQAACDEYGITLLRTGIRLFHH